MDSLNAPNPVALPQVNLQTLIAAIQNAVRAQNLIATNLKDLNTTITAFITAFSAVFPAPLTSSATWNPPSVSSGASTSTTVSVAGAVLGNYVEVSFSNDLQGLSLVGYVSVADTVTVVLSNLTGSPVDLASGTLRVRVTT